jgi:hypothetical protein
MRGLGAAQKHARERERDELERERRVNRARVRNCPSQTQSDRYQEDDGAAEQQDGVLARVASMTRRRRAAATATALDSDQGHQDLQAVENEQPDEQVMHGWSR